MKKAKTPQGFMQVGVRRLRVAIVGFKALCRLVRGVIPEFDGQVDFDVHELDFEAALSSGADLGGQRNADVIITAGAYVSIVQSALPTPVVTIGISGYDLLIAFKRARRISNRIGLLVYGEKFSDLDEFSELLNIEISQRAYLTLEDAEDSMRSLKASGFEVIVGSSLAVDLSAKIGIKGILTYSTETVRNAIQNALQIGMISFLSSCRYESLNAVLQHLQQAVLAVDKNHRITAINPLMEAIVNIGHAEAIGVPLQEILPELSLRSVIDSGGEDMGSVLHLGKRTFVVNRIPIHEQGVLTGAMLTLQDAQAIQKADTTIRSQRKPRNLSARYSFGHMIGSSPTLLVAIDSARRYARNDSTILISGESGTGKELFAQAIHNASRRAGNPFVAINCAAFPEALLESELFGHEEGAFTGSRKGGKSGLFEMAHTGTIFLDEIGDMPISLQTRLLRVLQEREVIRVGGVQPISVDLRIIAATYWHIPDRIEKRLFRADLYYRLNILRLDLPSLAERREDIPELCQHLLKSNLRRLSSHIPADQALTPLVPLLQTYSWPGNVRELENIMERFSVFISQYDDVSSIDYPAFQHHIPEILSPSASRGESPSPDETTIVRSDAPSPEDIRRALQQAGGNKGRAAKLLGISRTTFWRRQR